MAERELLLSLVQGISGREWANEMKGWNPKDNDVCEWEGIECDSTDRETIIGIDISNTRFEGTIPPQLGQLVTLVHLKLSQNLIAGTIPPQVADLPHLETLDLGENLLTGYLPAFKSPMLKRLDVAHNVLFGSLPDNLGERHDRLEFFDVTGNSIYGTVPASFATMKSLKTLALSENEFSGTIPGVLGKTNLNYLYVDNNNFVGMIPAEITATDSHLMEVWLQHNYLSGTIPAGIAGIPDLYDFYIDGNKFTGTIPSALCTENLNKDFFDGAGDNVDHDFCDAVSCKVGEYSFDGLFPCKPCEEGTYSPYLGQVGRCIGLGERQILDEIYKLTKGDSWAGPVIKGWKSPDVDHCERTGVTCDVNKNVVGLNLSGMNLQGRIPEEIGFLKSLQTLDLSNNQLYGVIPSDLRWCPLNQLDVSGNKIGGQVPPMLCLKPGINGNGKNGDFNCHNIACPVGTFSDDGFEAEGGDCEPCPTGRFLASKVCPDQMIHGPSSSAAVSSSFSNYYPTTDLSGGEIAAIFFGVLFIVVALFGGIVTIMAKRRRNRGELVSTAADDEVEGAFVSGVQSPDVAFS